jgi:hypothetical protein
VTLSGDIHVRIGVMWLGNSSRSEGHLVRHRALRFPIWKHDSNMGARWSRVSRSRTQSCTSCWQLGQPSIRRVLRHDRSHRLFQVARFLGSFEGGHGLGFLGGSPFLVASYSSREKVDAGTRTLQAIAVFPTGRW